MFESLKMKSLFELHDYNSGFKMIDIMLTKNLNKLKKVIETKIKVFICIIKRKNGLKY